MNIKEYNSQNMGKQVLVLEEKDIKNLIHFSNIAKNENIKGLIVSGKYVGFTDTYRLAAVKDTREELLGLDNSKVYPISILEKLKKARSMAVLKDGKLAIQVGAEVTEYEPVLGVKVPDIKKFITSYEFESHLIAKAVNKITDDTVWRMLKLVDRSDIKFYFCFEDGKLVVKAYPNEDSVLLLEVLNFDNKKAKLKTALDVKYTDLWLRYIKDERFEITLCKDNRKAIQFSKDNVLYIVMPLVLPI